MAESQGRFHYLDRAKFLFNARGSLYEGWNWLDMMVERGIIKPGDDVECKKLMDLIVPKLNRFISSHFQRNLDKSTSVRKDK